MKNTIRDSDNKLKPQSSGGRQPPKPPRKGRSSTGGNPDDDKGKPIRVGKIYNGTATRIMKFGALVEITPNVEGLGTLLN